MLEVDHVRRTHFACHTHAGRHAVHADEGGGAQHFGTGDCAQANRAQGEYGDGIADRHCATFCTGKTGGHDIGTHQHVFVTEPVRNGGEVGHCVRYPNVFRLATVDDIAELPATDGLEAMHGIGAVLGAAAAQAGIAVAAGGDGAGDDALPFMKAPNL